MAVVRRCAGSEGTHLPVFGKGAQLSSNSIFSWAACGQYCSTLTQGFTILAACLGSVHIGLSCPCVPVGGFRFTPSTPLSLRSRSTSRLIVVSHCYCGSPGLQYGRGTRATIQVHHFFPEVPQFESSRPLSIIKRRKSNCAIIPRMKKAHGQGTRREACKTKWPISDDCGLRSPVIQKPL